MEQEAKSTQVLEVPRSVTVSSAVMFAENLAHHLDRHDCVTLNLDNLAEVDLSFVQIVYAAREQANRDDKVVRLARPATAEVEALLWRAGILDAPSSEDVDFWLGGKAAQ